MNVECVTASYHNGYRRLVAEFYYAAGIFTLPKAAPFGFPFGFGINRIFLRPDHDHGRYDCTCYHT
jgi:hypothetical protein